MFQSVVEIDGLDVENRVIVVDTRGRLPRVRHFVLKMLHLVRPADVLEVLKLLQFLFIFTTVSITTKLALYLEYNANERDSV